MKKTRFILICLILALLLPLLALPAHADSYGDWEYQILEPGKIRLTKYNGSKTDLTVPTKVNGYDVVEIGANTFRSNSKLKTVAIPGKVTSIGTFAFASCSALTDVDIEEGLTAIGEFAFSYNTALKSISIPESVTMIDDYAFFECTALTDVFYGGDPDAWGELQIEDCNEALFSVTMHYGTGPITAAGSCGASGYTINWTLVHTDGYQLTISGAGRMADYTSGSPAPWYKYAGSITEVTVSSGVTRIGDYVFKDFGAMTEITVPCSVTAIGSCAFYNCITLADLYFIGTEAQWDAVSVGIGNAYMTGTDCTKHFNPAAPVLTVTAAAGKAVLSWTAVPGSSQYRVYRRDNESGSWSGWAAVASGVKTPTWTDTNVLPGKQYKYRVRAYAGGAWTDYSNAETVAIPAGPPAPVLAVSVSGSSVALSWNAISGAKYRVYRRMNESGTWSGWSVAASSVTSTTWTDTNVVPGGKYKYQVRSYAGGVWSDYSNAEAASVPPLPVLTVSALTGKIKLSWNPIPGATQVRVYRRDNESGTWSGWSMVKRLTSGTSWSDTDVISGKSYKYRIRAYVGGAWTEYSNAETVKAG